MKFVGICIFEPSEIGDGRLLTRMDMCFGSQVIVYLDCVSTRTNAEQPRTSKKQQKEMYAKVILFN